MAITLEKSKDVTGNKEISDEVRGCLSGYADSIKYHNLKNFGQKIKIKKILSAPSYLISVKTQYEKRSVEKREKPYNGGSFSKPIYTNVSQVVPWDHELDTIDGFQDDKSSYVVEGSQKVSTCTSCNGRGKNTCPTCNGHGSHDCPSCNGNGRKTCTSCNGKGNTSCPSCSYGRVQCSSCDGSGRVQRQKSVTIDRTGVPETFTETYYENCSACSGSGKRVCSTCGGSNKLTCKTCGGVGKITCKTCAGSGSITCEQCRGVGEIRCGTCEGKGKLVRYFAIVQELKAHTNVRSLISTEIRKDFPEFDISKGDVNEILATAEGKVVDPEDLEVPEAERYIRQLFNENHTSGPLGAVTGNTKILFERASLGEAVTVLVEYEYQGDDYSLIWYGAEGIIYAPKSPFSKLSEKYLKRAKSLLKSGFYGKCLDNLDKAEELDVERQFTEIPKLRKNAEKRMNRQYLWGEYAGKLFTAVAAWYCVFEAELLPGIIMPFFQRQYALLTVPENVYTWGVFGLVVITLFCFKKKLKWFFTRNYGTSVRNGFVRIGLSFIYTVLFGGLIYGAFSLAHASGILPSIALILNSFYDWISPILGPMIQSVLPS
ncbi:MAG: hypothetical protein ACLFR1_06360 [Spirochaetia bacterium]